ncbi:MAG: hypothetical protein V9E96_21635 [Chitinophagaceae bacterium]
MFSRTTYIIFLFSFLFCSCQNSYKREALGHDYLFRNILNNPRQVLVGEEQHIIVELSKLEVIISTINDSLQREGKGSDILESLNPKENRLKLGTEDINFQLNEEGNSLKYVSFSKMQDDIFVCTKISYDISNGKPIAYYVSLQKNERNDKDNYEFNEKYSNYISFIDDLHYEEVELKINRSYNQRIGKEPILWTENEKEERQEKLDFANKLRKTILAYLEFSKRKNQ